MTKIYTIQYLRAIAAFSIVFFHLKSRIIRLGFDGYWPNWLEAGVDLFFVISGFIMVTVAASHNRAAVSFLLDRIIRIVPIYWVWTTVWVILGGGVTSHVVASYLFIPWPNPIGGEMSPILIPGWTLNYEMFFYAVLAICLYLFKQNYIVVCLTILLLISLFGSISEHRIWTFLSDPIILEFAMGMIIGKAWQSGRLSSHWAIMILGFLMLPIFSMYDLHRFLTYGIPSALILIGALDADEKLSKRSSILMLLGDASYSIYLVHGLALSFCFILFNKFDLSWQYFVIFGTIGVTAFGLVAFFFVEKPLLKLLKRRS